MLAANFLFKILPGGSFDKTKAVCSYCQTKFSYHWTTSGPRYHTQAKHTSNTNSISLGAVMGWRSGNQPCDRMVGEFDPQSLQYVT